MEAVLSIFQSFFSNAEYLVPTVWVAFGCFVAWFLLSAKREQELTEEEVEMLWVSHKQFKQCLAKKIRQNHLRKKVSRLYLSMWARTQTRTSNHQLWKIIIFLFYLGEKENKTQKLYFQNLKKRISYDGVF